jgi:hypothetical protein
VFVEGNADLTPAALATLFTGLAVAASSGPDQARPRKGGAMPVTIVATVTPRPEHRDEVVYVPPVPSGDQARGAL